MLSLIVMIFLILALLSFFESEEDYNTRLAILMVVVVLVMVAGFRPIGIDADSLSYQKLFYSNKTEIIEVSFLLIVAFVKSVLGDIRGLFLIYAVLGVVTQMVAIRKLTKLWALSLLMLMSNYFILQDMTQIRVAVSSGLFLIGLYYLAESRRWMFFLFILLCSFFHYSSMVLVPLLFLSNKGLSTNGRYFLAVVIPLSYILFFLKIDLIASMPIPYVQDKIELYKKLIEDGVIEGKINVFNLVFLTKMFLFYLILWKYDIIIQYNKYLPILLKIFCISMVCFIIFSSLPPVAFRISELYGAVEFILLPLLFYAFLPEDVSRGIVVLMAFIILSINLFYNKLLIA